MQQSWAVIPRQHPHMQSMSFSEVKMGEPSRMQNLILDFEIGLYRTLVGAESANPDARQTILRQNRLLALGVPVAVRVCAALPFTFEGPRSARPPRAWKAAAHEATDKREQRVRPRRVLVVVGRRERGGRGQGGRRAPRAAAEGCRSIERSGGAAGAGAICDEYNDMFLSIITVVVSRI